MGRFPEPLLIAGVAIDPAMRVDRESEDEFWLMLLVRGVVDAESHEAGIVTLLSCSAFLTPSLAAGGSFGSSVCRFFSNALIAADPGEVPSGGTEFAPKEDFVGAEIGDGKLILTKRA